MMLPLFFTFYLLLLLESVIAKFTFTPCNDFDGQVKIHDIQLTPDPLVTNQPATIYVNSTLKTTVNTDAYVKGTIQYLFLSIPIDKTQLSDYVQLPINMGNFQINKTEELGKDFPVGSYNIHLRAYQDNGNTKLFCLDATLDLV